MGKKTRNEKIAADARRTFYSYEAASQTLPRTVSKTINNALISDLRKTAVLIGIILAFQVFLFLALKNKIILLPGVSY